MKKLLTIVVALTTIIVFGQQTQENDSILVSELDEVIVSSGVIDVAKERVTPIAFSTISKSEIDLKAGNLEFVRTFIKTPGVYQNEDNGGYGDGQMWLRGFSNFNTATVINGQPVNDMENGKVYWSNWAGLTDVTSTVQIQRGLGSTSLATPSVGGTVSIITDPAELPEGGKISFTAGNDSYMKTTVSYATGKNAKGWSSSYLLSQWSGDGYRNGTAGEGTTYFVAVGYSPEESAHNFNLSLMGAGQWHHQAYYGHRLEDYLDAGPKQGNDYRKFNYVYGQYRGEEFSVLRNYYHKPLGTFNWDWKVNDNISLSTSLYGSAGRGGGTGTRGRNYDLTPYRESFMDFYNGGGSAYRNADYTINWDAVEASNLANAGTVQGGIFDGYKVGTHNYRGSELGGSPRNTTVRRFSTNSHNWFGGISKLKINSDNFRYEVGVDLRTYAGFHYRGISDFIGLDGFISTANEHVYSDGSNAGHIVATAYESSPFKDLGFKDPNNTQRNYKGNVRWTGFNGLIEYVGSGDFTAVLQAGTNSVTYFSNQYYFTEPKGESPKITVNGGYLKGGASFQINKQSNVFANAGFIKRPPVFDGVFINADYDYEQAEIIENETITSFELGYNFFGKKVKAKINAYSTTWGDRSFVDYSGVDPDRIRTVFSGVEQNHIGIEAEATWFVSADLRVNASLSAGDWKYTKNFEGVSTNAETGASLGSTGTLYMDDVKIGDAAQFTTYLGATYIVNDAFSFDIDWLSFDGLYGDFDVTDSVFSSADNDGAIKLPAYNIIDLGLTYKTELFGNRFQIRANINNLFDEEYISQANTNVHAAPGDRTWNGVNVANEVYFGYGTTYNVRLKYSF